MSDSAMRVKPAIDEPSIHCPPSMTCSKIEAGIVTLLTMPITSVNWRLMKRICSASIRSRICSLVGVGPGWPHEDQRGLGTNVLLSRKDAAGKPAATSSPARTISLNLSAAAQSRRRATDRPHADERFESDGSVQAAAQCPTQKRRTRHEETGQKARLLRASR